ncbi:signal recognition particle-docking protein FtsY [Rhodomicrobium vannielii ATCC 17100]|uniref:Signal recognition particle receptor FtsY n=1 Tax=Rhodomicrobium vannielii (strain ATCC 17100 / DSM 162 / LMG 4299 / NCIMB 10020 / ATH 3.1.1) TaxID=648757 RepID=E3I3B7_RHOVT|nr:signal recognition particle-docking protein FtsY [Rhodomicrobium vannielii]ADP71478.1 signal recognition particle-docking protein FtsY [Rhodomicrobium vannielii ATCC 17100]
MSEDKRGLFGSVRMFGIGKKEQPKPEAPKPEAVEVETPLAEPVRQAEYDSVALAEAPVAAESWKDFEIVDEPRGEAVVEEFQAPSEPSAAPVQPSPAAAPEEKPRVGWLQRLKQGLTKTSSKLTEGITGVFTKRKLDDDTLEELEDLLIQSDLGLAVSARVIAALKKARYNSDISPEEVRAILAAEVEKVLGPVAQPLEIDTSKKPYVVLMVGVNGTGKTTTIGKYAKQFTEQGLKVMLAAGDTFRAAAIEQLKVWGERTGAPVVSGAQGADAAGLAFDALTRAKKEGADLLIIDTAGRLQNKTGLMAELEKIIRVIRKVDPEAPHSVLLTLDATTGQNALSQVEIFGKTAGVTGLIMTKLDGTARGGILVAIAAKHGLPVHAIGVGESASDLQAFSAQDFARAIAGVS